MEKTRVRRLRYTLLLVMEVSTKWLWSFLNNMVSIHVSMVFTALLWVLSLDSFYEEKNVISYPDEEICSTFSRSQCVTKPVGIHNSVNDRLGFVTLYWPEKLTHTNKRNLN